MGDLQVATRESVFDTALADQYRPNEKWENINYFDPSYRWNYREEKRIRGKTDVKIFLWLVLMFISLNLVRQKVPRCFFVVRGLIQIHAVPHKS